MSRCVVGNVGRAEINRQRPRLQRAPQLLRYVVVDALVLECEIEQVLPHNSYLIFPIGDARRQFGILQARRQRIDPEDIGIVRFEFRYDPFPIIPRPAIPRQKGRRLDPGIVPDGVGLDVIFGPAIVWQRHLRLERRGGVELVILPGVRVDFEAAVICGPFHGMDEFPTGIGPHDVPPRIHARLARFVDTGRRNL